MKAKRGQYRLSPNEEAQLIKEETERRRRLRLQQVREQSKQNAARIRHAVKKEKNRQLQKLASDLQNQLEKEKEEKVRHLENQYENSLRSIGQGHKEAGEQDDREQERYLMQLEDNKRADSRHKIALERQRKEKMFQEYEEKYQIIARQVALEEEKKRAAKIAALPPRPADPVENLQPIYRNPVKMTDIDNFTTTHYHIREDYAVDKADPNQQEDARIAAEDEQIRIQEKQEELVRLHNDRLSRARVRHNNALEKELLAHDYDKILHDLSDLQRADRDRRQRVVAHIPKQVFEPPHRRMEDKEERQKEMEEAFEDMYMANTEFMGDLSLALDPHPPPDTPTATESLDASVLTENTPVHEPSLARIPVVLKDTSNIPKKMNESSPKKPEKVLKKLMDRIKNQRQEWMSRSVQEVPERDTNSSKYDQVPTLSEYSLSENGSPQIENIQPMHAKYSPPEKQARRHVDLRQEGDRHLTGTTDALLHPMEVAAKIRQTSTQSQPKVKPARVVETKSTDEYIQQQKQIEEQKRQLEIKLKELEERQNLLNNSILITPSVPPHTQVQGQPGHFISRQDDARVMMNGHMPHGLSSSTQQDGRVMMNGHMPSGLSTHHHYVAPSVQQPYDGQTYATSSSYKPANFYQPPFSSISTQQTNVPTAVQFSSNGHVADLRADTSYAYSHMPNQPLSQTAANSAFTQLSAPASSHMLGHFQPTRSTSAPFSMVQHDIPRTFLTPSLPIPSTVSMTVPSNSELQFDHIKKVKEYQQSLLLKHEQSKRVLAETRAEIEKRRKELLERFPQLEFKSPDSVSSTSASLGVNVPVISQPAVAKPEPRLLTSQSLSPNKVEMSTLLSKLASQPYYAAKLTTDTGTENNDIVSEPEKSSESQKVTVANDMPGANKRLDEIRKSLPFDADDTIHESPCFSGNRGRTLYKPSPGSTTGPETDLNDTAISSSTDRGSPSLMGRVSGRSAADMDSSLLNRAKERKDFFDKRQQDLKNQLEEIQRQKEEILRRHNVGQNKLLLQQDKFKTADTQEGQRSIQTLEDSKDEPSILDSSDDQLSMNDINKVVAPPSTQTRGWTDHKPHELSTIQEIDTPSSTQRSGVALSGRPSLSSSDRSTISRHSLEFNHRATIPEVNEDVDYIQATPTNRRTVGDTGYQSAHIQNALAVASEFTPGVLQRLHKQTNDVFYNLNEDSLTDDSQRQSMLSLSTGPVTPDSQSTGADRTPSESLHVTPGSESLAFKYAHQQAKKAPNDSTDGSFKSGKSWADELSSYSEKFHTLQPERASTDSKPESVLSQFRDGDRRSVDRRYEVLHVAQPDTYPSKDQTPDSKSSDKLSEYSLADRSLSGDLKYSVQGEDSLPESKLEKSPGDSKSVELSQYALSSETSPQSQRSGTEEDSPASGLHEKDFVRDPRLASMASTMSESAMSSVSSYMDFKPENGNGVLSARDFDFIGRNRVQISKQNDSNIPEQTSSSFKSPGHELNSYSVGSQNFSGKVDFTSTPNAKTVAPSNRLSQISQFTVSPEESRIQAGSGVPTSEAHFTKLSPQFDISSFSTDNQPQAFTKVNQPNFLSRVSEEHESMTSDNSQKSGTPNLSKFQDDSSLSQFTMTTDHSSNDVSLTQITLNTESPGVSKSGMGGLSQYASKTSPNTHGKTDSSLSQYSMDSPSTQNFSDNKSDMNFSNNQTTGTVNSQNSILTDSPEEDESSVEKKFANLDLLIKESRDLITKHKQLINKNKDWEAHSSTGESISSNSPPPPVAPSVPPVLGQFKFDTSGTSALSATSATGDISSTDVSPLRVTDDGSIGTMNLTDDLQTNKTDPSGSYLDQLAQESGITDEPDLTLVTLDSEVSHHEASQSGNETHRSEGASSTNDSVLSFEQHEMSFDGSHVKDDTNANKKQEQRGLKLNVDRDAGDENVFRAVPVLASPTVALSMKFNSSQDMKFTKPPVSWSFDDEKPKTEKDIKKNAAVPQFSKVSEPHKTSAKLSDNSKSKMASSSSSSKGSLNRALQPRKPGDVHTDSENKLKSTSQANPSGSSAISLGDFLSSKKEATTLLGRKSRSPATAPKPQRSFGAGPQSGSSGPSALSKTLSSWKKNRSVKSSAAPPPPTQSLDLPYSTSKVLPKDLPPPSRSTEEKMYEKNMRAYNPRLFRLQNRIEEGQLIKSKEEEKQKQSAAHREKVKEFQKKLQENMRRKQQMKREKKLQQQKM